MQKIGFRLGLVALLLGGSLFLANLAFAMCATKGTDEAQTNKKVACSCCCSCACCK